MEQEFLSKAEWGPGPWQDEPDRVEFKHAGLPCLLNRGHLGNWCGYVAVPPGHPLHGHGYDDADVDVHGGLTYAGACQGHICHVPEPGEPDDVWWFGFDCGHCWDLSPAVNATMRKLGSRAWREIELDDVYRDLPYVRRETESLAEQLAGVESGLC